jgi:hypothetical protein
MNSAASAAPGSLSPGIGGDVLAGHAASQPPAALPTMYLARRGAKASGTHQSANRMHEHLCRRNGQSSFAAVNLKAEQGRRVLRLGGGERLAVQPGGCTHCVVSGTGDIAWCSGGKLGSLYLADAHEFDRNRNMNKALKLAA